MNSDYRPKLRVTVWFILALLEAVLLVLVLLFVRFSYNDLWSVLELLVVPAFLGAIAFLFQRAQKGLEEEIARQRREVDILQEYFDRMSDLMLNHSLRETNEGAKSLSEPRALARAITLTVLKALDGKRKAQVVRFLIEANLIRPHQRWDHESRKTVKQKLPVVMKEADLSGLHMPDTILTLVNLREANMSGAELPGVTFSECALHKCDLRNSNLSGVKISHTSLRHADLRGADLRGAELDEGDLFGAKYDRKTKQPSSFSLSEAGAVLVNEH